MAGAHRSDSKRERRDWHRLILATPAGWEIWHVGPGSYCAKFKFEHYAVILIADTPAHLDEGIKAGVWPIDPTSSR